MYKNTPKRTASGTFLKSGAINTDKPRTIKNTFYLSMHDKV